MSREDYLSQVIRNLESDRENLIRILVDKFWCPCRCETEDYQTVCKEPHASEPSLYCGEAPEDCWQELAERKRPPETYCTR